MSGPHEVPGPDEAVAGVVVGVDMREDGVGGGVSGDHDQRVRLEMVQERLHHGGQRVRQLVQRPRVQLHDGLRLLRVVGGVEEPPQPEQVHGGHGVGGGLGPVLVILQSSCQRNFALLGEGFY